MQFINANGKNETINRQFTTKFFKDFAIISGNIGKIGIGFVSCFFDVILLVQHFCLYGKNNARKLEELAAEEDSKSPLVSQDISLGSQLFQNFSKVLDQSWLFVEISHPTKTSRS